MAIRMEQIEDPRPAAETAHHFFERGGARSVPVDMEPSRNAISQAEAEELLQ
jgi:hypothetical protein